MVVDQVMKIGPQEANPQGRHIAVLLSLAPPLPQNGKELYEIPVAITGTWVKGEHRFSITRQDLADMVRNFKKRENHQVVIDYEHASEQPEVAKGGPIPAAGWIHQLAVGGWGMRRDRTSPSSSSDSDLLCALVEWTPEAREMIRNGQYRFFSPAIDWGFRDKETGQPQGATLTSGALTNHPFLEELPPILLTDFGFSRGSGPRRAVVLADVSAGCLDGPAASAGIRSQGESTMAKELCLKKLTEGKHAGHHGIFDGDDLVGYLSDEHLRGYAREHLGVNPDFDEFDQEKTSERFAERLGVTPGTTLEQVRQRLAAAQEAEEKRHAEASWKLLLAEAVKDGQLDNRRAELLARTGRISLADYIAAQEAERALNQAVMRGKILPRDRQFFFRDALERPKEFAAFVERAMPVVRFGSEGIGSGEPVPVDQEVDLGVRRLMSERNISYGQALKQLLRDDPALEARYRAAHNKRIGPDGAPSGVGAGVAS